MKIIGGDNFCRDNVADYLVAENISDGAMAKIMCDALNAKLCKGDDAPTHYRVVPDDYRLSRGMADLV